jgi:hypothetical protein
VSNVKDVTTIAPGTVEFACRRCVQAGETSPPTLAVVGNVPEVGGVAAIVRSSAARRWAATALTGGWADAPSASPALRGGNVAVARLLPRARHRPDPAPGVADATRAAFVALDEGVQTTIFCPRHASKGIQVSKSSLVRKAEKALASSDQQQLLP